MPTDPDGRYLMVWTQAFTREQPQRSRVVRGSEVADYLASGWRCIGEDPAPHRYASGRVDDAPGS